MRKTIYKVNMEYECDINVIAKDILSNIKETPWNREIIESWIEVAISTNVEPLYNTPDEYEYEQIHDLLH